MGAVVELVGVSIDLDMEGVVELYDLVVELYMELTHGVGLIGIDLSGGD